MEVRDAKFYEGTIATDTPVMREHGEEEMSHGEEEMKAGEDEMKDMEEEEDIDLDEIL